MSYGNGAKHRLDLVDLAALPLDHALVSACFAEGSPQLAQVDPGTVALKAGSLGSGPIRGFAVAEQQEGLSGDAVQAKPVWRAPSLMDMAGLLHEALSPSVYGHLEPASTWLTCEHYAPGRLVPAWPKLASRVAERLRSSDGEAGTYVCVWGTPWIGKTAWALQWVRASQARLPGLPVHLGTDGDALPSLAGWYLAPPGQRVSEHVALTAMVARARQRKRLRTAGSSDQVTCEFGGQAYDGAHLAKAHTLREFVLRQIQSIAQGATPEAPAVMLLDGAEVLWDTNALTPKTSFADLQLPVLPAHCHVVLVGRPGRHFDLCEHQIQIDADVLGDGPVRLLVSQAQALRAADPQLTKALDDPLLVERIRERSGGSLSYVTRVVNLLRSSRDREKDADALPDGAYEAVVKELLGLPPDALGLLAWLSVARGPVVNAAALLRDCPHRHDNLPRGEDVESAMQACRHLLAGEPLILPTDVASLAPAVWACKRAAVGVPVLPAVVLASAAETHAPRIAALHDAWVSALKPVQAALPAAGYAALWSCWHALKAASLCRSISPPDAVSSAVLNPETWQRAYSLAPALAAQAVRDTFELLLEFAELDTAVALQAHRMMSQFLNWDAALQQGLLTVEQCLACADGGT